MADPIEPTPRPARPRKAAATRPATGTARRAPAATPRLGDVPPEVTRSVSVVQGGLSSVTARQVDVQRGGIGHAQAQDVAVHLGGIGVARAERVSVELGGLGLGIAREARVTQGIARTIVSQQARLEQGLVGAVVTGRATFERTTGVVVLIAGRVDGPVKALLDWRGALAFGAAFAAITALVRRR